MSRNRVTHPIARIEPAASPLCPVAPGTGIDGANNGVGVGAAPDGWSKELVRAIAMDIGKAAVHHLETMYPAAVAACPATMKLSLRNCIHNEIMAALETTDADEIADRLRRRKEHRRKIKAAYTKIRAPRS